MEYRVRGVGKALMAEVSDGNEWRSLSKPTLEPYDLYDAIENHTAGSAPRDITVTSDGDFSEAQQKVLVKLAEYLRSIGTLRLLWEAPPIETTDEP